MSSTLEKIESFLALPSGWFYGSGSPPAAAAIGRAKLFLSLFNSLGFLHTDAFPGVDGEIMISAYEEEHCIELTIETDGTYRIAHQAGDAEEFYSEGLSNFELAKQFSLVTSKVKQQEWLSSGSSTQTITTRSGVNSRTWRFGLNESQMVRSPSPALNQNVLLNKADRFALTSGDSTMISLTDQLYFGSLTNRIYQPAAA